jgi:hypothetical protein
VANGERYLLTSEADDDPKASLDKKAVPLRRLAGAPGAVGARVVLLDTQDAESGPALTLIDEKPGRAAVLRYGWAQATQPLTGLLTALELASVQNSPNLVSDLEKLAKDPPAGTFVTSRPELDTNLKNVQVLTTLLLTQKR